MTVHALTLGAPNSYKTCLWRGSFSALHAHMGL